MSRELYCPKCDVEYWGEYDNAKCSCGHIFTKEEKDMVLAINLDLQNEDNK
tara:strand:+ start:652 stop:804 length:153 start_codon:yes stop_codon:yes gene_type:complete